MRNTSDWEIANRERRRDPRRSFKSRFHYGTRLFQSAENEAEFINETRAFITIQRRTVSFLRGRSTELRIQVSGPIKRSGNRAWLRSAVHYVTLGPPANRENQFSSETFCINM